MAIKKDTFKGYLKHYMSLGMSPREAYQRMLRGIIPMKALNYI